ncbi:MAG: hypothetical protein JXB10_17190 [Pirellulales bacterium]|nr:hypothetical protein [Pirellulales bacterium]
MGYVIGTDEAGYGPNLGPLVITATVWSMPDGVGGDDLFTRLRGVIRKGGEKVSLPTALTPGPSPGKGEGRMNDLPAFADSKVLYTPGKGLRQLERGLWTAWELLDWRPRRWRELWQRLAPETHREFAQRPWYRDYDAELPCEFSLAEDGRDPVAVCEGFRRAEVTLCNVHSRAVFPDEWNTLLETHASKGAALSHLSLELITQAIQALPPHPSSLIPHPSSHISVLCDKHGGRNRYLPLLYHFFPEQMIEILGEGRAESVYRFGPADRRIEFRFRAKAEAALPAALASMVSKYLREQAMRPFNKFWTLHVPDLAPTAGYPQDARRFMQDIHVRKKELQIEDRVLWRNK